MYLLKVVNMKLLPVVGDWSRAHVQVNAVGLPRHRTKTVRRSNGEAVEFNDSFIAEDPVEIKVISVKRLGANLCLAMATFSKDNESMSNADNSYDVHLQGINGEPDVGMLKVSIQLIHEATRG